MTATAVAPDPGHARTAEVTLAWAPTAHCRRLVSVALVPLLAAVAFGHPGYLVLAAPVIAALAMAARRPGYGARVSVLTSGDRCFEGEEVTVWASVQAAGGAGSAGLRLVLPAALTIGAGAVSQAQAGGRAEAHWRVRAQRWGRWDNCQIRLTVRSAGGLYAGVAVVNAGEITVFPHPPPLSQLALPARLHTRIGDHVDRQPGEGVEFAGVRAFAPGDKLRRINWPVTSRRGALHVNQLAAERAADIVVLIDAFADTGPPGRSTLDRAVHGAAGIARAYTRAGDRVGVITVYGPLRWLGPGIGERQFFRIAESVLEIRNLYSFVSPDLARIPPQVLPPGALVVMFSPLLDQRVIDVALDLRERGYALIITDVLATSPVPLKGSVTSQLAVRVWRLQRRALRYRLESAGIPVVGWPGVPPDQADDKARAADISTGLDLALGRFARQRLAGGAR